MKNTKKMIDLSRDNFSYAYKMNVMGVYGTSKENRTVYLKDTNQEIVDFVRCGYLGLDSHPEVLQGAKQAMEDNQSTHWSCARTRLNYTIIGELEEFLSSLFSANIITFSTVMLANMGVLPLISSGAFTQWKKPTIVFDKFCHASLNYHKPVLAQDAEILTIPHNDMNRLEAICQSKNNVVYVADGVYSMGGEAPLSTLKKLQEKYGLFLYIDDAHGTSIVGKNGEGFSRSHFPKTLGEKTIITTSLGKGFGSFGGMTMFGTKEQEHFVRCYAQPYAFSAAPNIPAIGAAMASAKIHATPEINQLQDSLYRNLSLFDCLVETEQKNSILPIRMIELGETKKAIDTASQFLKEGFYVSAVFFPTVAQGRAGLRISISANHRSEDIKKLCEKINWLKTSEQLKNAA